MRRALPFPVRAHWPRLPTPLYEAVVPHGWSYVSRQKLDPFRARQHGGDVGNGAYGAYPIHIIKIVVPFAPAVAPTWWRARWAGLARELGVSVIIENKPGAGTIIAPRRSARPNDATRC